MLFYIWQVLNAILYLAGAKCYFIFGRHYMLFYIWQVLNAILYLAGTKCYFIFGRH